MRLLLSTAVVVLTLACSSTPGASRQIPAPQPISNALITQLAKEDQAARRGDSIARSDEERRRLVLAEIARGAVRTPADKANAALVLQHTGITFCGEKIVSLSADNYLLAHHLANQAFEAGYSDAQFLVAQTIDRYLSLTEGYQKYGTNRFNNQVTGGEEWAPIDRSVTDAERAKYGVPPLAVLLKQFPEQKKTGAARADSAQEHAVRSTVEQYLHGLKVNDVSSLRSAFWPEAKLFFVKRDGNLGQLSQEEWYRGFAQSAGKEEEGDLRIATVEVTGDIASVKVVETYPKSVYVDYLSLLRLKGQWFIVNKVYTSHPR